MARPAAEWERLPGRGAGARLCDFLVLPFFWIMTGVISLTTGNRSGAELMLGTGAGAFSAPSVAAGAVADMILGMLIARRPTVRLGLWGAIAVAGSFSPAGSMLRPDFWNEPLGPLMKFVPIITLHFVALAILEER